MLQRRLSHRATAHRSLFAPGLLLGLLSVFGCSGPLAQEGPRPAGALSRAFIDGAEVKIRYRFDPTSAAQLEIYVDVTAVSGDAGELVVELEPAGFEVVGGPSSWPLQVAAGHTETRHVALRVLGSATPAVTVVTTRNQGTVEVARDTLRFLVRDMQLRECQNLEEDCAEAQP